MTNVDSERGLTARDRQRAGRI